MIKEQKISVVDLQMLVTGVPDKVGMRLILKCEECNHQYNIDEYDAKIAQDIDDAFTEKRNPIYRDISCPKCNANNILN